MSCVILLSQLDRKLRRHLTRTLAAEHGSYRTYLPAA